MEEENQKAQYIFEGMKRESDSLNRKNQDLENGINIDEQQLEALRLELEK